MGGGPPPLWDFGQLFETNFGILDFFKFSKVLKQNFEIFGGKKNKGAKIKGRKILKGNNKGRAPKSVPPIFRKRSRRKNGKEPINLARAGARVRQFMRKS